MLRIGVISDTHGHLDPRVLRIFEGVDHILHAGDVGYPSILLELETVAPVTAVLGNTDVGLDLRETEVVALGERPILVRHIVHPEWPDAALARRIARERAAAVVFGHTHKALAETRDGILFLNPGYSGRPRHGTSRSVAVLEFGPDGWQPRFIPLD
jgi:putative phosphoesterase